MKKTAATVACVLVVGAASARVYAVDGVAVSIGRAGRGDDTDIAQLHLTWNWQKKWLTGGNWFVGAYWEASLGLWSADNPAGGNKDVGTVGITSVLRLQETAPSGISPYVEGGLGFHLLSDRRIHAAKDMGSDYQFGSHLGLGIRFGSKGRFDLGYRFQHFSNAGIEEPNPGINFHQIRLQYHF